STSAPTYIRLSLYEDGPAGPLVMTLVREVLCQDGVLCFFISDINFKMPDIPVSVGDQFFIELTRVSGGSILTSVIDSDVYPGGTVWSNFSGSWAQEPSWDLAFETTVGVPDTSLVPFFKITDEGNNSKVEINDYAFPISIGSNGDVMVLSSSGQLQWQDKEDNDWEIGSQTVFTTVRNVGIGEENPDSKLHINESDENDGTIAAIKIETPGPGSDPDEIMLLDGNEIDAWGGEASGDNDMLLLQNNSPGDVNLVNGGGNVGIGKENSGDSKVYVYTTNSNPLLALERAGERTDFYSGYITHEDLLGTPQLLDIQPNGPLALARSSGGSVGIGTGYVPIDYKLAVNGKIVTEEVLVQTRSDWPDYVFKSDYPLRDLSEVKRFIGEHKHLPEVPSEQEVYANGVQLGEMQKTLLKKIEELTLYIIQQEERIKKLEAQIQK
ncbi:MAG: hypothetical protein AAGK97_12490, partial [Bacteroidota bacterium]